MSLSNEILSRQILEVWPKAHQGEDLTIRVWAILQIPTFIHKIGWIEHTNDWDLAFEVTIGNHTWFSTEVTPLNSKGEPYTMENGVNELITAIRLEDWWDDDEGSNENPKTFQLTDIDRIYYG